MTGFDIAVIGAGPGGYVCAIRAAQLGMKVAVIEKRAVYGGTCLNVGCIPSKALLHASEKFHEAASQFAELGIKTSPPQLDLKAMMAFKDKGVKGNTDGVAYLFKKNKIEAFHGAATIRGAGRVDVRDAKGETRALSAKKIVIATGSQSAALPGLEVDERLIVSSTGALALDRVPEHLVIIGGGVIGLELGSVWRRLGAKVTVIECMAQILPGMDEALVRQFQRSLKRRGFNFMLASKVVGVERLGDQARVLVEGVSGDKRSQLECDAVLLAIGRTPYTSGLGLEEIGVRLDSRGRIDVDVHYQSSVQGVYAIGDVIRGPMLAHKAEDEGMVLAEQLAGQKSHVNYAVIPSIIYTNPEVATVGRPEQSLKQEGVAYKSGSFPFTANGRARVSQGAEGFVRILADAQTDRVLGVHIIGPNASEMIGAAAVLMEFGGAAEDLARTCCAHPTLSEALKEAALAVAGRAVHM